MIPRRLSLIASLVTSVIVLLAFVSAVPVAAFSQPLPARTETSSVAPPLAPQLQAQASGYGEVSITIVTCDVVRPADTVTFTTTFYKPEGAYNCVDGLPDGTELTVADIDPDMVTTTTAVWYYIADGTHQIEAGEGSTPFAFDMQGQSLSFYALYERAVLPGGWAEIHVHDCAIAPTGTATLVEVGSWVPDGYSICVDGNIEKRDYGLLVDGQPPTYGGDTSAAIWQLRGGNHVATGNGGAQLSFDINAWTFSMDLYTKGTVSSEPPITDLPNTGVGSAGDDAPGDRDALASVALLVASVALGYVSYRTARVGR